MSGTTMVVLIVFISVGFGVMYDMYQRHLRFKEKSLKYNAENNKENEALKLQVSKLEERVQILEKIVTDEGYAVNKEISGL
ncbi:hypothetical protein DXX93_06690 [Thalassotalea euphylliae]|uniref:Phage shock protein B n=1 Tax=Thalassotalea euphylliae TaxID=1655234 RepID=A0A3E0TP22_9GAMM|nr:hypothetical protein [Thalassotalea euphylliae]REL26299.1 hypothetical protein DXX93_06690 [Thalassotalea euphylliae]